MSTRIHRSAAIALALTAAAWGPCAAAQSTLASTLKVYAFPSAGQDAAQQATDESACYTWASENTGLDPLKSKASGSTTTTTTTTTSPQTATAAPGSGARGALRGAAAGAVIGEVANDDAGKGAAIGATTGLVAGRMRSRAAAREDAQRQAEQQAAQQTAAAEQDDTNFKKAFSTCLEAKKYLVKF